MGFVVLGTDQLPNRADSAIEEEIRENLPRNSNSLELAGKIVSPGDVITEDAVYMGGFGTYKDGEILRSSVAGAVGVLNKLITAGSFRGRFSGEIGDVVVARITEVGQKRWKVDVNARQDGTLMLSSVILPGGVQRRKSESDELRMRQLLSEGDLLVAEVQSLSADGSVSLHTRNTKYGKLRNGCLVKVPPLMVQRCRTHFIILSCGVNVILGLNGYIWVSKCIENEDEALSEDMIYSAENDEILPNERENIARVANCIRALSIGSVPINETNLSFAYEASLQFQTKELILSQNAIIVAKVALSRSGMVNTEG